MRAKPPFKIPSLEDQGVISKATSFQKRRHFRDMLLPTGVPPYKGEGPPHVEPRPRARAKGPTFTQRAGNQERIENSNYASAFE